MNSYYKDILKLQLQDKSEKQRQIFYKKKLPLMLYPYQLERQYAKAMSDLFKKLTNQSKAIFDNLQYWSDEFRADTPKWIMVRSDGFVNEWRLALTVLMEYLNNEFSTQDTRLFISTTAYKLSDWNLKEWKKSLDAIFGINIIADEPWELDVINSWADDNYNLIKSLGDEYIKKINLIVSDNVKLGKSASVIKKEIVVLNQNISGYRARLIARDQVGKLNGLFTKRRMQDIGQDLYQWITAGDERVREDHKKMANKICKWSNANVYSSDGKTWTNRPEKMQGTIPGSQIQCRCTAIVYMDDFYREVENEIQK